MPSEVLGALERGSFCHLAAGTSIGPHLTPMVFVVSDGRLWVTTSRGSVKAGAWRRSPEVGGLVRTGDAAVTFTGRVHTYDLLDPRSWEQGVLRTPAIMRAAVRFTRKNARFFAGYAVDAHRVPMSWTPPGRVFAEIEVDRAALVDTVGIRGAWGGWSRSEVSRPSFRAERRGPDPLDRLPRPVSEALARTGVGALALHTGTTSVVLPARWVVEGAALYACVGSSVLELAGLEDPSPRVALTMDRPSWWRARKMLGAMVQGRGEVSVPGRLRTGARSAERTIGLADAASEVSALVRVRPERLVWWRGWESGSARV